jgi:hypothetical protein
VESARGETPGDAFMEHDRTEPSVLPHRVKRLSKKMREVFELETSPSMGLPRVAVEGRKVRWEGDTHGVSTIFNREPETIGQVV